MKTMRQLISLMEGVMPVPGVGSPNGTESDMQTAGTVGRNQAYSAFDASQQPATESAPPGMEDTVMKLKKEYPGEEEKAFATAWSIYNKKNNESVDEAHVDTCRMEQDGVIRDQCAMEGIMDEDRQYDMDFISSSIRKNYDLATSEQELMRMVAGETGYGQNPDFANMFSSSLDHFLNGDDTSFDHMGDDDYTDQSMRAGEMGMEEEITLGDNSLGQEACFIGDLASDKILAGPFESDAEAKSAARGYSWFNPGKHFIEYGSDENGYFVDPSGESKQRAEMSMEEDFNNGYDTEQYANGSDFFPNGADSPVVTAVGPSGARQGDNPEQKKIQVAEVHKELVYGYRKYLKESTK